LLISGDNYEFTTHRICPEMSNAESGFLKAFDAALNRIHEVADKVYVRRCKGSYAYVLAAEDLEKFFACRLSKGLDG
jgi:hypothetical protein